MRSAIAVTLLVAVALLVAAPVATADQAGFYAMTNTLGYQGTVWNETQGTGPWTTATPRVGYLYTVVNYSDWSNYNYIMSDWSEHHVSNTNDSFLQLGEVGNPSVTSATAAWDSTLKVFNVTVSGSNATYDSSYARFWQPDNGVAWGVTFTDYTYSFTATFSQAAALDSDGWFSNTVDPDTITGSFTGHFVVTDDVNKNPITNGDTYGFDINFSKDQFVGLDTLDAYGQATSQMNYFGTPAPEPATMMLMATGVLGLAGAVRRRLIG